VRTTRRRAGAVAVALGAVLALAGCSGGGGTSDDADVADQGYVSGDGSFTQWAAADREGPVEVAGTDYAGQAVDVADWRGDVVVLNTWYAACPPCREEAPDLVDIAHEYAGSGVHLLGINGVDDAGAAEPFQTSFEVPYPSIDDRDKQAIAALQGIVPIQATPTTVVLDRDGKVAARIVGLAEGSTLRALIDEVLAEDSEAAA
jgi:peroxiredoxin